MLNGTKITNAKKNYKSRINIEPRTLVFDIYAFFSRLHHEQFIALPRNEMS